MLGCTASHNSNATVDVPVNEQASALVTTPSVRRLSPEDLFAQCNPSVVRVILLDDNGNQAVSGSGFVVAGNRVLTAAHVVHGAHEIGQGLIVLDSRGRRLANPKVVAIFDDRGGPDLAIIQLGANDVPALGIADWNKVRVGQHIFVIGSPEGLAGTLSDGLISQIRQGDTGSNATLQITAPISHGSSGGPILMEDGSVVGVANAFLVEGQNINFAVPIEDIRGLLDTSASADAFASLRRDAESQNLRAVYEMGFMYEHGYGVERDWSQALSWYRRGADAGDLDSTIAVGDLYDRMTGPHTENNYAEAMRWFRKAAGEGSAFAMYRIGELYACLWEHGIGKDEAQAVVWFRSAADAGSPNAMCRLGMAYETGAFGLPSDSGQAKRWLLKAANAGNFLAQSLLDDIK